MFLQFLCDRRVNLPSTLYCEGQSVQAKVVEIDAEKKRFLLSLRMADCYHGDTSVGVKMVASAVRQYRQALSLARDNNGNYD